MEFPEQQELQALAGRPGYAVLALDTDHAVELAALVVGETRWTGSFSSPRAPLGPAW
jgi:hypothetical protein